MTLQPAPDETGEFFYTGKWRHKYTFGPTTISSWHNPHWDMKNKYEMWDHMLTISTPQFLAGITDLCNYARPFQVDTNEGIFTFTLQPAPVPGDSWIVGQRPGCSKEIVLSKKLALLPILKLLKNL